MARPKKRKRRSLPRGFIRNYPELWGLGLVAFGAFLGSVRYAGWNGGWVGKALVDGFDVLIGGAGQDQLSGGGGNDLLIAGTTTYDHNPQALLVIQQEWTSSRTLAQRMSNLRGGSGPMSLITDLGIPTVFTGGVGFAESRQHSGFDLFRPTILTGIVRGQGEGLIVAPLAALPSTSLVVIAPF